MAQITTTAGQLVRRAFLLINRAAPDEELSSDKMTDGLFAMNQIISKLSAQGITIPFMDEISFDMESGEGTYYFGYNTAVTVINSNKLMQIDVCNVTQDGVIYPVSVATIDQLENLGRQIDTNTRPYYVRLQVYAQYSYIEFASTPNDDYPCKIFGRFEISEMTQSTVLNFLPPFFQMYLTYYTAKILSSSYRSESWTSKEEAELQDLSRLVKSTSYADLTYKNKDPFGILPSWRTYYGSFSS